MGQHLHGCISIKPTQYITQILPHYKETLVSGPLPGPDFNALECCSLYPDILPHFPFVMKALYSALHKEKEVKGKYFCNNVNLILSKCILTLIPFLSVFPLKEI